MAGVASGLAGVDPATGACAVAGDAVGEDGAVVSEEGEMFGVDGGVFGVRETVERGAAQPVTTKAVTMAASPLPAQASAPVRVMSPPRCLKVLG